MLAPVAILVSFVPYTIGVASLGYYVHRDARSRGAVTPAV
mgnify:CR=1 FL=1